MNKSVLAAAGIALATAGFNASAAEPVVASIDQAGFALVEMVTVSSPKAIAEPEQPRVIEVPVDSIAPDLDRKLELKMEQALEFNFQ